MDILRRVRLTSKDDIPFHPRPAELGITLGKFQAMEADQCSIVSGITEQHGRCEGGHYPVGTQDHDHDAGEKEEPQVPESNPNM